MSDSRPDFALLLAYFARIVQEVLRGEKPQKLALEPRQRLLPLTKAILNGRRSLPPRGDSRGAALVHHGIAVLHLALLVFPHGDPEERLFEFLRLALRRHEAFEGRTPSWWEAAPSYCFDRSLANAVSVAYEIDGRCDPDRIAHQAADCANYLVYFLVRSGVRLEVANALSGDGGRAA